MGAGGWGTTHLHPPLFPPKMETSQTLKNIQNINKSTPDPRSDLSPDLSPDLSLNQ